MGELAGIGTTRLSNSGEVDTEVLEQLDLFLTFLTSFLISNYASENRAIVFVATCITEVNVSLELMATVIVNGVEHLKCGVAFTDKGGHSVAREAGSFSILEGVVGIDANVFGLTKIVGQSNTLGGAEVLVVVALVVGVGVGTHILDNLNKVASLFVEGTDADSIVLVKSLLET